MSDIVFGPGQDGVCSCGEVTYGRPCSRCQQRKEASSKLTDAQLQEIWEFYDKLDDSDMMKIADIRADLTAPRGHIEALEKELVKTKAVINKSVAQIRQGMGCEPKRYERWVDKQLATIEKAEGGGDESRNYTRNL